MSDTPIPTATLAAIPVVEAPATVVAPDLGTEETRDGTARRAIEERASLTQERASPHTTEEQDRHTQTMRDINLMWEGTQRLIALLVTITSVGVTAYQSLFGQSEGVQTGGMLFLSNVANLVIGFYFGRSNHDRTGGVKPQGSIGDRR